MDRYTRILYSLQHRPLLTEPNGISLVSIISIPEDTDFNTVRRALDIVRYIHGDGNLPAISVQSFQDINPAALEYDQNNDGTIRPRAILVNLELGYSEYDVIHEIGHLLDIAIAQNQYASRINHPLLKAWREAIENTKTVQQLHRLEAYDVDQEELQYLLDPAELFARSYAQFIATASTDSTFRNEVGQQVSHVLRTRLFARQWNNEEFEPVAYAFEQLFARLGWVK